jgi:hypothetical protein
MTIGPQGRTDLVEGPDADAEQTPMGSDIASRQRTRGPKGMPLLMLAAYEYQLIR